VTTSPVEAEATGQEFVTATFGGTDFRLPADADTWPLHLIGTCVGFNQAGKPAVDYRRLITGLELLLGDQWPDFVEATPKRRGLVEASHVFAAAAGFPRDTGEHAGMVFGELPRTLALIAKWPDKVESDLSRFWGLRYPDRWRIHRGRRRLTLREIHVRLSNLPGDSALARAMGRYTPAELVLMDLYEPLAGRAHPQRPLTKAQLAERRKAADKAAKQAAAVADYKRRHGGGRRQAAIEQAQTNARREGAHAHQEAQTQA
jgi:hypothetical protein